MQPFLRKMVWGGRRLEQYGKQLPLDGKIGESWELSAYPGMESVVSSGPLVGCSLPQLLHEYGARLLGEKIWDRYEGNFPLLVKLIDANEDLSIQVHPDDAYVRLHDLDRFGKMEAWYVLRHSTGRGAGGAGRRASELLWEGRARRSGHAWGGAARLEPPLQRRVGARKVCSIGLRAQINQAAVCCHDA